MKLSEIPFSPYAGIGSRETPNDILELMSQIASKLYCRHAMVLRSGGADGADIAFQAGVDKHHATNGKRKEIFIPWEGFSNLYSINTSKEIICVQDDTIIQQSQEIAAKFHGGWANLKQGARRLMARNTFQVLGADLNTPSKFVLCWTQDGANGIDILTSRNTGGTGQAIRIAAAYGIPVMNLYNKNEHEKWSSWLKIKHEFRG